MRMDDALSPPEKANWSPAKGHLSKHPDPREGSNASKGEDHDKMGRISQGSARYKAQEDQLFLCLAARKPEKCFAEGEPDMH